MPHTALFDDTLADCYQAVEHIIECYGQNAPQSDERTYAAGELLLIRTTRHTVVKFKGREVMRIGLASSAEPMTWHPSKTWLHEVDRIYESIQPDLCA